MPVNHQGSLRGQNEYIVKSIHVKNLDAFYYY